MATKKVTTTTKETVLDAYAQVIEEARAEFEAEKVEQAAAWKKELDRKKEEDLYQFNKDKRDREDKLEAELSQRILAVSQRESSVEVRELDVDHAEDMIQVLQDKVDSIPDLVSKAESIGYAKATADAGKSHEAEIRLLKAEFEADKRILTHGLQTVDTISKGQEETIKSLREELSAANDRVQTIATNAVTSAGQSKVTVNAAQGK